MLFILMQEMGLGITDDDLGKITIAENDSIADDCLIYSIINDKRIDYCDIVDSQKTGLVYGKIGGYAGNCMPGPGRSPCSSSSIGQKIEVYITRPSYSYKPELQVGVTETDQEGNYQLDLPIGDYSLFILDNMDDWEKWNSCKCGPNADEEFNCRDGGTYCDNGGAYICDYLRSSKGCVPFTVEEDKETKISANIDHAAW